jgi:uncharacterized membrane protein
MKDIGTVVGPVVAFLVLVLGVITVVTWPTMIMFGVVHSYWAWLPAFGFWETLGVLVLTQMLTASSYTKGS